VKFEAQKVRCFMENIFFYTSVVVVNAAAVGLDPGLT
jgi:hypothetical protein